MVPSIGDDDFSGRTRNLILLHAAHVAVSWVTLALEACLNLAHSIFGFFAVNMAFEINVIF